MSNPLLSPQLPVSPGQMNPQADGEIFTVPTTPAPFKPAMPEQGDPQRRIILPGADYPPAGAIPVDETNNVTITSGGTGIPVTVTIPDGYSFRVSALGIDSDDESVTRFSFWSLLIDPPNSAIIGYSNRPGVIGSVRSPGWIFTIQGNGTVKVQIGSNYGLTAFFTARLLGWFYREEK